MRVNERLAARQQEGNASVCLRLNSCSFSSVSLQPLQSVAQQLKKRNKIKSALSLYTLVLEMLHMKMCMS